MPFAESLAPPGSAVPPRLMSVRLALFYAAYFIMIGIVLPFWPTWLESRGMTPGQIGVLLALGSWAKLVGNPIVTRLADRSGELRRTLILVAAAAFVFQLLFAFARGFWALLIVTALSAMCFTSIMPLGDALAMGMTARHGLHYGRVRLWGSVAFILSGAAAGWLLAGRPADHVLVLVVGALGVALLACLLLPDERSAAPPRADAVWIGLLSSRRFVVFLLASGLIQSSHAVLYGFGTLHWLAAGHGEDTVGLLWAVGVVAEVGVFAAGRCIVARLGPAWLLVLAGVAGILRWSAAGLSTELAVLLVVQLLHGLTFGAAHLAAMYYLVREVPAGLATTAQGLYGAFAWGAAFGVAMLVAGVLYAAYAGGAFIVMAGMSLAGAIAALALTGGRH